MNRQSAPPLNQVVDVCQHGVIHTISEKRGRVTFTAFETENGVRLGLSWWIAPLSLRESVLRHFVGIEDKFYASEYAITKKAIRVNHPTLMNEWQSPRHMKGWEVSAPLSAQRFDAPEAFIVGQKQHRPPTQLMIFFVARFD